MVAAFLVGLGLPALAASQFASTAYNQAANIAGGKAQADATYDGTTVREDVPSAGGVVDSRGAAITNAARPAPMTPVPAPDGASGEFFNARPSRGVATETRGGPLPGLAGALVGAVAGSMIGFILSKTLS